MSAPVKSKRGIATTLKAACAKTGLSMHKVQIAKEAGCDAFKANGRIDCDLLLKFVDSQPQSSDEGEIDFYEERARDLRITRMLKEQTYQERAKQLVSMDEVNRILSDAFLPVRQRIMSLPSIANLCNPTDPAFARKALQVFADESWPLLRAELDKAKNAS